MERRNYAFGELGGRVVAVGAAGSRIFVRLVALSTPIPIRITTPTPIHIVGTLSKYAAKPSPPIRIKNPTR